MSPDASTPASPGRLAREIDHHRRIADEAEIIWNWDTPAGRIRVRRRAGFFVEAAGLRPGRRALELGCGTGLFLDQVAASGASITGIDLTPELLARAGERLASRGNVSLCCGDAEALPFHDHAFDVVYGSSILHHLDLDRALAEVHRVLKPGGRIAFTEPNVVNPQIAFSFYFMPTRQYFGLSPDEMAFSRWRAMRALTAAGFVNGVVRPFDFLHPATPAAFIKPVSAAGSVLERLPLAREIAGSLFIAAVRR
jgi:SAM-dependent methyltransferase